MVLLVGFALASVLAAAWVVVMIGEWVGVRPERMIEVVKAALLVAGGIVLVRWAGRRTRPTAKVVEGAGVGAFTPSTATSTSREALARRAATCPSAVALSRDDVVDVVVRHVRQRGWTIELVAHGTGQGPDVQAQRGAERMVVGAGGSTSGGVVEASHVPSGVAPFDELELRYADTLLRAMSSAAAVGVTSVVAMPFTPDSLDRLEPLWKTLTDARVVVFLVGHDEVLEVATAPTE
jgi:hypothetical protein